MSKRDDDRQEDGSTSSEPSPVGYGHPPVHTRFQKGQSGNRGGRPKGRRNIKTLTKELFNRPVPVRADGKTTKMPAVEAMFRVVANNAAQGNLKAATLINKLRDMAGLTDEFTEEEWQQHVMRLPRAPTEEESDLLRAPAREKDRQRYLAMREGSASDEVPEATRIGDEFAVQSKIEEALASYQTELELRKTEIEADAHDETARKHFRCAVSRIGLLANSALFAGRFTSALKIADGAIAEAESEFWGEPEEVLGHPYVNATWISHTRAYARMFTGDVGKAKAYFLNFNTSLGYGYTSWELAILRDFVELRMSGLWHPLMTEVEGCLATAKWVRDTTEKLPLNVPPMLAQSAEITLADALAREGKLQDALVAYDGVLTLCKKGLQANENDRQERATLYFVVGRIVELTRRFLMSGKPADAWTCTEMAQPYDPHSTSNNLNRAHALMFLGHTDDARTIYYRYHGRRTSLGCHFVHDAIKEDFKKLRAAGRPHVLMDAVERKFAGAEIYMRKHVFYFHELTVEPSEHDTIAGTSSDNDQSVKTFKPTGALTRPSEPRMSEQERLASASDIVAGDKLRDMGLRDDALAVYLRRFRECESLIASGRTLLRTIDDRTAAVQRVSEISFEFLLEGDFTKALATTETMSPSGSSSAPPDLIDIRRAHALLLLGRIEEAKQVYSRHHGRRLDADRSVDDLIIRDFERLRRAGITVPNMSELDCNNPTKTREPTR